VVAIKLKLIVQALVREEGGRRRQPERTAERPAHHPGWRPAEFPVDSRRLRANIFW